MQPDDSSTYSAQMNTSPRFPEPGHLKCPRCDSSNTKFCYYNNYNLSQPRHFCKNCRRYWTKGGTLRNIPIGGGTRKNTKHSSNSNKRAANSSSTSSQSPVVAPPPPLPAERKPEPAGVFRFGNDQIESSDGSFSSMFGSAPGGQFAKLLMDGLNPSMEVGSHDDGLIGNPTAEEFESNFLSMNRKANNQNGWPDLSIYTPGSSFH